MSLYSVCVCLVPFFNRISLPHIDIGLIFACFVTLLFSKQRGPVYGCVCGFLTGFSCTNPLLSAPLGIAAIPSGYLITKSKTVSSICFSGVSFFAFVYLFGTSFALSRICEVTASTLIFTLTSHLLPNIFSSDDSNETKDSKRKFRDKTEYEKVCESLSGMSAILYKFAEHMKSPCATETALLFDSALDEICKSCSMSEMCYAKRNANLKAVRSKVVSILSTGRITKDALSHLFLDKCIKIPELCDCLNAKYSELNFITQKSNRTQTVACLYNSMSHLIKSTSKNESNRKVRDNHLEQCIGDALTKVGIDYGFIIASGTRCKEVEIHKIRADKIPCTSKELCDYLSDKCKILFSEPTFDISDSADMVMKFSRREEVQVEYAQCSSAKSSTGVNGDTTCFFDTDKGYFYSIIADGMGSGKTAAATSRLSCVFLEKMLVAGTSKNVCLEMLNNLLLSKNDETFSGIDLLEIDKLCGKAYFIKAGAAPSFVLRNSRLYKISSQTPPVGIIHSFSAESTRFALEKNDVIIMMSDGVIDCDSDGLWLSELIRIDRDAEPSLLAKELIEKAKSINSRSDDASACVIRII